ncbi:hypothetical protein MLD63_09615 [Paracoccus sp. TK19116]|uniref:ASCH domain-containing protein n=1 Tax=Paracoccus albicereus TaxID=2922394 RepID=A0ABT1MUZ0_9RHOB|nr:hypothetical protein [Paracoccus albicereus]MCQ0970681.1 hypothetical protein [Paracoccus albicereus]
MRPARGRGYRDMMNDPVQTLDVVPRLFPAILRGEKTRTIRWREGLIRPGPLRFVSAGASVMAEVTQVTDMPLRAAAAFVGMAAEWPDAVMLGGMREHYPAITLDDVVQVVAFRLTEPEAS